MQNKRYVRLMNFKDEFHKDTSVPDAIVIGRMTGNIKSFKKIKEFEEKKMNAENRKYFSTNKTFVCVASSDPQYWEKGKAYNLISDKGKIISWGRVLFFNESARLEKERLALAIICNNRKEVK